MQSNEPIWVRRRLEETSCPRRRAEWRQGRRPAFWIVWAVVMLGLLGWKFSPAPRRDVSSDAELQTVGAERLADHFAYREIEDVRVGQRVIATDADFSGPRPTEVDPEVWKLVRLEAESLWPDGTVDEILVETLQPPDWLASRGVELGAEILLPFEDLVELGLPDDQRATVAAIEPCPELEDRPGRVVLSTITHLNPDVYDLTVTDASGYEETFGVTGLHKFYSLDREEWTSTKDLLEGERLAGLTNEDVLAVASKTRSPGVHRVYNMTVEEDHYYHVGAVNLLSHNTRTCGPGETRTYVTYLADEADGTVYVGRASGIDMTPEQVLARRMPGHHRTSLSNFRLDKSVSTTESNQAYAAIRGREQILRDHQVVLGRGADQINPIRPRNPQIKTYLDAAKTQFGEP